MVYTLFVLLIVIVSILMILIVLIQESKGGGLSSQFAASNQIMGVPRTTDIVEKITWGLAIAMVVLSIICAYVAPQAKTDESVLEQNATQTETTNPVNTQGFGTSKQATGSTTTPNAGSQTPATQKNPATPKAPSTPAN